MPAEFDHCLPPTSAQLRHARCRPEKESEPLLAVKLTGKTGGNAAAAPRLSRTRRPEALPVADWQAALRRQFGREHRFALRNLGVEPVFATFRAQRQMSLPRRVALALVVSR